MTASPCSPSARAGNDGRQHSRRRGEPLCHADSASWSGRRKKQTKPVAVKELLKGAFVESWRKQISPRPRDALRVKRQQARVEIWIAPVRSLVGDGGYSEVLSCDEVRQFRDMRSSSARASTMAGRALLRVALSSAVQGRIQPADWRLIPSGSGKPEITQDLPQVHFSVAHTESLAVVATSNQLPLGVDAESLDQTIERDVVASFCCPGEWDVLEALPPSRVARDFLRLWTLKEAYAKLAGLGTSLDFSSLGFSLDSLDLRHGPTFTSASALPQELEAHFETMFVAHGGELSHVSLAIGLPASAGTSTQLRVVNLAADERPCAIDVPCILARRDEPSLEGAVR